MADTTWNGNQVPSGTDFWNLVADLRRLADNNNRLIPVYSKAERDSLSAPGSGIPDGTVVIRLDQSIKGLILDVYKDGAWIDGDTGWVTLTMASGYTAQNIFTPQVRRIMGEVRFDGIVARTNGTSFPTNVTTLIATMPPWALPIGGKHQYLAAPSSNANYLGQWVMWTPSGEIQLRTTGETGNYYSLQGITYRNDVA